TPPFLYKKLRREEYKTIHIIIFKRGRKALNKETSNAGRFIRYLKKQAGYKKRGITHSDIYIPPTPEGNHPSGRRRITDNRKDMLF
ncbi:hypothetical protein, partial [Bacteroides caccae]|uniref:hypothetical protein n=1 Tax=Bacteroides caccae TaxID=47678 RepID=UPI00210BFC0D